MKSLLIAIICSLALPVTAAELPKDSTVALPVPTSVVQQAVATSIADQVTALLNMGRCEFPSFSPDGKRVVFLSTLSGKPEMWTVPVAGGWPTQITLTKEGVIGGQWSPKSNWIAFMVGNGDRQLCVVRGDGSDQKAFPIQVALSDWTPDGKQIMFASSFEGKTKTDNTYLLNPDSGELQHAGKNTDQISDVSQDHHHALLCHWVDNHDTNLWLYDFQSGKQSLITPQTGAMYSGAGMNRSRPHFSADGKNVYVASNEGRKKDNAFGQIKLSNDGSINPLKYIEKHDGASLSGFAINDNATRAALVWEDRSGHWLSLINLLDETVTRAPDLPLHNCYVGEIAISNDGKTIAVSACDVTSTYDIYLLDILTQRWRRLTYSPHPGVDLAKLSRPDRVEYKTAQGVSCEGLLYRPAGGATGQPYVINLMGDDSGFGLVNESLRCQGLGVFVPICHSQALNLGAKSKDELQAIKAGVDYLVSKGLADPKRIGIYGFSHFGFLAVAAATEYPDSFAACVDEAGPTNFETWAKRRGPFMVSEYGNPQPGSPEMDFLCPVRRLDRMKAAMMVQQGLKDTAVNPEETQQVIDDFKRRGVPIETELFADEGHAISKRDNQIKSTTTMVEFFAKTLKSEPRG